MRSPFFFFFFSTDKSTLKSIEIPKYGVTSSKVLIFMISWVGIIVHEKSVV
jgi:hypothetical protein